MRLRQSLPGRASFLFSSEFRRSGTASLNLPPMSTDNIFLVVRGRCHSQHRNTFILKNPFSPSLSLSLTLSHTLSHSPSKNRSIGHPLQQRLSRLFKKNIRSSDWKDSIRVPGIFSDPLIAGLPSPQISIERCWQRNRTFLKIRDCHVATLP